MITTRSPSLLVLLLSLAPMMAGAALPEKSSWHVTSSGSQEDAYPASAAADGVVTTRWSSAASDPQWLEIDLVVTSHVSGAWVRWETAFATEYDILLSVDGRQWTTNARIREGDGRTDYIDFAPAPARYVRMYGHRRGTGWGYSIWELDLMGEEHHPTVTASDGSDASAILDGDRSTQWRGCEAGTGAITIGLEPPRGWGGLRIDWGTNWATAVMVESSLDGTNWTWTAATEEASGPFDVLMQDSTSSRFVRVSLAAPQFPGPIEIAEIAFKGPDEPASPLAQYRLAARKARPGFYPEQLRDRQVYWTLLGLSDDTREALFDEYGNVEPLKGGWSVMPYVFVNGGLHSALDDEPVQGLEDGWMPLPTVGWDAGPVRVTMEAQGDGMPGDAVAAVRYFVANASHARATGSLFLVVRPVQINPTWQYGGLAAIRSLAMTGSIVRINGAEALLVSRPPEAFGARRFWNGDVLREVARGFVPGEASVEDADERVSGALRYDFALEPGAGTEVVIAAPLHRAVGASMMTEKACRNFAERRAALRGRWSNEVPVSFHLPDRAMVDTIQSQLAYILMNKDGAAIQPGSRQYERSWIRDGGLIVPVLLRLGRADVVREFLDWYQHFITPEGSVPPSFRHDDPLDCGPGSGIEYDGQGFYIHAVYLYYRFTQDRAFLDRHYGTVKRAMDYLVALRERTLVDGYYGDQPVPERFRGILPKSFSHEGYYPEMHSYWDDFSALMGWKEGAEIARITGHEDVAAWAAEEYGKLRASVKASIEATIAFKGIDYVPGCAEKGDLDPASTALAFDPCRETGVVPSEALRTTFDRYYKDYQARRDPAWRGNCTPYEARCIGALIGLHEYDRGREVLDGFMAWRFPPAWNHWPEVILGDLRVGSYIGDMPHSWGGAGVVHAALSMLVHEQGPSLVLLEGAPERWLEDGGVVVNTMPTWYGPLTFSASMDSDRLTVTLSGAEPPEGFRVHWPRKVAPKRLTVDGEPMAADLSPTSTWVPGATRRIEVEW
jgi:hypothetical protein